MNRFRLILLYFVVFTIIFFFAAPIAVRAAVVDFSGWAWSDTIGWISFNRSDPGAAGAGTYSVQIDTATGRFSGNAWSDTVGWISFDSALTGAPPSGSIARAVPSGQLGKSDVNIQGWARVLSHSGWDGWIRFDHGRTQEPYINDDYELHGWAWGSDVVGWISFDRDDPGAAGAGNYSVSISGGIHSECEPGTGICMNVPGAGSDLCNNNGQCAHRECVGLSCNSVPNTGPNPALEPDLCTNDGDCYHKECNSSDQCIDVAGPGMDLCNVNRDCVHYECNLSAESCDLTSGSGADQCNPSGIMDCKPPILWRWWETVPRE